MTIDSFDLMLISIPLWGILGILIMAVIIFFKWVEFMDDEDKK